MLVNQYNLTANSSYGSTDYDYLSYGSLADLPNLNLSLTGAVNPPSV